MQLRSNSLAMCVVLLTLTTSATGAEPELKAGKRLTPGGSRFSGGAAPEVADWDNDGLSDLVVGQFSGALSVYLNRGFGKTGFDFEQADIPRQDGFGNGGTPTWTWRFNKGTCVCPGPGRLCPRVVDWDNDGKKDLVIGDGRGAQTRVWRNLGTDAAPVFSTHDLQYLPSDGGVRPYHETVQPCIADWNSDGKKDLIMGRNRGLYVYLNEGTDAAPSFNFDRSRLGTKIRNVFPTERLSPVLVDWDVDGRQDLLVGSQRGEVWFARNVGSKTHPEFNEYSPVQAGGKDIHVGSEARIAVADLDGDGRNDLLAGGGSGLVWFFQASNPNPVARARHARVKRGSSLPVKLVGTDDAGRTLTYSVLTQPKHGTLDGTVPNLTYTPEPNYLGKDEFTFRVATGNLESTPARVSIDVEAADRPPSITTQPADAIVAVEQAASFRVVVSGTAPFSYQWHRNGEAIPRATGPDYSIPKTTAEDSDTFSVTIKNVAGTVSSRDAALRIKPLPSPTDDVPVVGIRAVSAVAEPATAGVLTLTRTGNTTQAVTVRLASRRHHDPALPHLNYVPLPSSITLKPGQTTARIRVTPIDDTLAIGRRATTFLIVPNPEYRIEPKLGRTQMTFLDDDCPNVSISVVKGAKAGDVPAFQVTALPAPRRATTIHYSVGGTAIGGVDYGALPGSVTIPAGETSATIAVRPYRQTQSGDRKPAEMKSVELTLPAHRFTFFDFYRYLTVGRPRASVVIATTDSSPPAPTQTTPADPAVEKLRREVSRLGWIVFSARSSGPNSDLDLFVMRPDGSQLRNFTSTAEFDEHSARVSPNGKQILYRRTKAGGRFRAADLTQQDVGTKALATWPAAGTLVVASVDGGAPRALGDEGAFGWATWGPDGKRIACLETVPPKEPAPKNKKPSYKIVIREADTLDAVKELPSAGIHSQAIWSPDGKRICGRTDMRAGKARSGKGIEYPLGIGKIASLDIESGRRMAMARFPDWFPVWATDSDGDWFQGGSPEVLHSANNYGICPAYYSMLWRSGLEREPSQLVFGEYMKNVWGGCTSPDDRYAVFVIGGDTWPLQGRMAIIRLADAPIARGNSPLFHEVLADYFPKLKQGPVLDLSHVREAFDPHWTRADFGVDSSGK